MSPLAADLHSPADSLPAIVERQVSPALQLAAAERRPILICLSELTGFAEPKLTSALAELFDYQFASRETLGSITPDFELLSFSDCRDRQSFCGRCESGELLVVLSDPFDADTEDWAQRVLEQSVAEPWKVVLASPGDVDSFLTQEEGGRRAFDDYGVDPSQELGDDDGVPVITLSSIGDEPSETVRLVNSTIYDALKIKASDIHFECDDAGIHVQFRVDGVLVPITTVSGVARAERMISRIKVMAELDIAERRIPQDGRFRVRIDRRDVDFRVSVMPNVHGEDAVLRLLDRQSLVEAGHGSLTLEYLGLDPNGISNIRDLAQRPYGMLLVTGPTGSGKTTTLYAAITEVHTGRDKIITIEDPVEYRLPRVLQIPVNEKKGLTFARGLRSILRHDPDKIMVGEIRDGETAQIAVQAALTGHLVFTTVHANSVFDVLGRFLHMGVDAYSFASALNGIVSQRLLRVNCTSCVQPCVPTADIAYRAKLALEACQDWSFRAGRGCEACRHTGFKGRRAIAEVLVLDEALREAICNRTPSSQLRRLAAASGTREMRDAALDLVRRGETTLEEFLRVAG